jgi:CBS domain-containing protein
MKVKDLMCPLEACATHSADTTLDTICSTMRAREIGSVVVFEEQEDKEIGIITMYDILDAICTGMDFKTTLAESIMNSKLEYIHGNDTRDTAAQKMEKEKIHHLIVQDGNEMIGLISSLDLTRDLAWTDMLSFSTTTHPQVVKMETGYIPRSQRWRKSPPPSTYEKVRGSVENAVEKVWESTPVTSVKKLFTK